MNDLTTPNGNPALLEKVARFEQEAMLYPQVQIKTEHVFHAGMYARTVRVPAGTVFANVLVKIPTMVIIHGTVDVLDGSHGIRLEGYNVVPAAYPRKHVYIARTNLEMTMLFPTNASTVEEAEAEFTDEAENLLSRRQENGIVDAEEKT